jgi:hypothetical protein
MNYTLNMFQVVNHHISAWLISKLLSCLIFAIILFDTEGKQHREIGTEF